MTPPLARICDLTTEEIASALQRTGEEFTVEKMLAVEEFIFEIGGLQNAHLALAALRQIELNSAAG